MELYLVRHGESVGNITPGQDMPDCPLTDLGEKQADLVAEELIDAGITHVISSPLIRTLQTAQPFARAVNKPISVMKDAFEVRHLDSCKGARLSDLINQFPEAQFPDDFEHNGWHYAGNENLSMATQRATNIVKQLKQYDADAKIAMFTHALLNQYLIRELLNLTDSPHIHFSQKNTCINWFTMTHDFTRVNKIGDINHLWELSTTAKK